MHPIFMKNTNIVRIEINPEKIYEDNYHYKPPSCHRVMHPGLDICQAQV